MTTSTICSSTQSPLSTEIEVRPTPFAMMCNMFGADTCTSAISGEATTTEVARRARRQRVLCPRLRVNVATDRRSAASPSYVLPSAGSPAAPPASSEASVAPSCAASGVGGSVAGVRQFTTCNGARGPDQSSRRSARLEARGAKSLSDGVSSLPRAFTGAPNAERRSARRWSGSAWEDGSVDPESSPDCAQVRSSTAPENGATPFAASARRLSRRASSMRRRSARWSSSTQWEEECSAWRRAASSVRPAPSSMRTRFALILGSPGARRRASANAASASG